MSLFKPGKSGNPAGRPPGPSQQARLRATIAKDIPDILGAMAIAAKAGDTQAARLLLDRVLPTIKAVDSPAPLPSGTGPADLAGASTAVLAALVKGDATPDQAASLASVLAALARVREVTELEQRITALEDRYAAPNPPST
jgi:hypothetical protein